MNKTEPLIEGEHIIETIHPHPLAFYRNYLIWISFAVVSILFATIGRFILDYLSPEDIKSPLQSLDNLLQSTGLNSFIIDLNQPLEAIENKLVVILWWYFLIPYGSFISLMKINFTWLFGFLFIGVLSSLLGWFFSSPLLVPLTGSIAALLGIVGTEWFRKAHSFIITNFRLIMRIDFIRYQEREMLWNRISDLAIEQTVIGRLFHFGTLIPISMAGFGLGSDSAAVMGGAQNRQFSAAVMGGRSRSVPRGQSAHVLFGVPDPKRVHNVIESLIHDNTEVAHLREIEKKLSQVKYLSPEDDRPADVEQNSPQATHPETEKSPFLDS